MFRKYYMQHDFNKSENLDGMVYLALEIWKYPKLTQEYAKKKKNKTANHPFFLRLTKKAPGPDSFVGNSLVTVAKR